MILGRCQVPASKGPNSRSGRNVDSEFGEFDEHELKEFMNAIKRQANPTFLAYPRAGPLKPGTWYQRFFYRISNDLSETASSSNSIGR